MNSDDSFHIRDIWSRGQHKERCTKLLAANVASHIVGTLVLACSIFQFAWAIALQLFSVQILNVDPITGPSNTSGKNNFRRTSSVFLVICGSLLLVHFVVGLITSRKSHQHPESKYAMQRYAFSVALGTNVILYCIVIIFCVAGKDILLLHQSAAMTTLQLVENVGEVELNRMTSYQSIFGCCGTRNVTDWLVPKFLGIPKSCCNQAVASCDDEINASGDEANQTNLAPSNFTSIYNDGCEDVITTYAYSTATLVGVNVCILVILFIAWVMLHKQRRAKVEPGKSEVKIIRSVQVHNSAGHVPNKSTSSVHSSFLPPSPRHSSSTRKAWPVDNRRSPEGHYPHYHHIGSKKSIAEYSDWNSIHQSAQEARNEWAKKSVTTAHRNNKWSKQSVGSSL